MHDQAHSDSHRPGWDDFLCSRRRFLSRSGLGIGALSLVHLLPGMGAVARSGDRLTSPMQSKPSHYRVRARRVIQIFAQGGPSHVDSWDPKAELTRYDGKKLGSKDGIGFGSPFRFERRGRSGVEVSELFRALGGWVDEMAVVRSMVTDIPSHDFGTLMMNTGSGRLVKPSLGSWVVYGLGTENQNLPGFIALASGNPLGGSQNWRSAFLPGVYQGTHINTRNTEVEKLIANIRNRYTTAGEQRAQLDLLARLNARHQQATAPDAELEARIQSFELAFQMQAEATDAFDLAREPESVRARYGATTNLGRQLLLARRLVERGVRVVQVWHGGWDHHQNLAVAMRDRAKECDQPLAALLEDLKSRGLLEETLVLWGGEFGRTPTRQLPNANGKFEVPGRNHNHKAFSVWLAGGGVKGGTVYGATDEFGGEAVEDKVHVHDLHATLLALLGFDHEQLTYRYNGRDFRLTDVYGKVIHDLMS